VTGCGIVVAVTELDAADATALPFELEATTVKVYDAPDWSPATEIGKLELVPVKVPMSEVAV
jgi:hypothetical protein